MRKPREVFIPSVDTKLAKICYSSENEALRYAMRKGSMSCGAPLFREVLLGVTDTDHSFTESFFRKIILDWKHSWMNQTQNSKEDFENYRSRAYGIDANMQVSLATRLVKAIDAAMKESK